MTAHAPTARCARALLRTLLLALVATPPVLTPERVSANGWEHTAVPFEALLTALSFDDAATRAQAARSLGFRGQAEAVPHLLALIARPETDASVRSAAYAALGQLHDPRAGGALIACVDGDPREDVRGECTAALGLMGDAALVPRLIAALQDPSVLVRSNAVDALGHYRHPAAVEALSALLSDAGALRGRAIPALGNTGSPLATAPLLRALQEARGDRERAAIVAAIASAPGRAAVAPLEALLEGTRDPLLRTRIVIALGAVHDGSSYPTLVGMLEDPLPAVRWFALEGLRELGDARAAPAIARLALALDDRLRDLSAVRLVADADRSVAELSLLALALRTLAGLDAPAGIQAMLAAASPGVALATLPRDSAVALAVAHAAYETRRLALFGLGYTLDPRAAALLAGSGGIGNRDARLRATAARSLGVLGLPQTAARLRPLLSDPDADVRAVVAGVLGRLHDRSVVPALVGRLSDDRTEVRRQAALALGYLGDPHSRTDLQALARDPDSRVREAAVFALDLLSH